MMARKKRIAILVVSIVLAILAIVGTIIFLYLKTDAFKSNETLFAKYFIQSFNAIDTIKNDDLLGIEDILNTNKYTSELKGKIEYTKNVETNNEDKNSSINQIGLNVKSNIDKSNDYNYKNITIGSDNENYIGLEYLKNQNNYGIRLKNINQFASNNDEENKLLTELGLGSLNILVSDIDINSICNFNDQEKQNLIDTYTKIVTSNVSKDKYYSQRNTLITVNNQDVNTNAYYIKMTVEEYNNLYIKILEQLKTDEIILSRIDTIEKTIKENYPDYTSEDKLRNKFINNIEDKIKDIQNNNIGSDEVKIIVYENKGTTVRVAIEKTTEKILLDLYGGTSVKLDISKIGYETTEKVFTIEKTTQSNEQKALIEYENKKNDEILNSLKLEYNQTLENDKITKNTEITIAKDKYKGIFDLEDNIKIVDNFENQIALENNVEINKLQDEQKNIIMNILKTNTQNQLDSLYSVASLNDYESMLQNLGVMRKKAIQISSTGEVTELERTRFNSQFEFFASSDLTSDNIKELLNTTKDNFEDMKVLLKTGEVQDLDMEKLKSSKDSNEYKKSIAEILFYIKRNSNNEQKAEDTSEYLKNNNDKYTVSIEYDSDKLVRIIRAKIQEQN